MVLVKSVKIVFTLKQFCFFISRPNSCVFLSCLQKVNFSSKDKDVELDLVDLVNFGLVPLNKSMKSLMDSICLIPQRGQFHARNARWVGG